MHRKHPLKVIFNDFHKRFDHPGHLELRLSIGLTADGTLCDDSHARLQQLRRPVFDVLGHPVTFDYDLGGESEAPFDDKVLNVFAGLALLDAFGRGEEHGEHPHHLGQHFYLHLALVRHHALQVGHQDFFIQFD